MKQRALSLIFLAFFLAACQVKKDSICQNQICTMEFRMVSVKFLNSAGEPIIVKDFSSVNQRNMQSMLTGNNANLNFQLGIYTVASDNNLRQLSEAGDTILVSARNPVNNVLKEGKFVIAGGECACHIAKISGPETIVFE